MAGSIRSGPVRVLVPASSANVGPGFDSLGLSLAVYDELIAMATDDEGVLVEVAGEGAAVLPRDERHLVVQAMNRAFEAMGTRPTGFVLRCRNAIPQGRGLGSSAAAIIGGMVLARAMVEDADVDDEQLLAWATTMESHPDNLAAALQGGFTVAWLDDAQVPGSVRLEPHPDVRVILALPAEEVPTTKAREALPADVDHAAASHNVARSALLVHAMTNDPSLLWEATSDRLHQRARADVYPQALKVMDALRASGLAAAISGAGPAVLVLSDDPEAEERVATITAGAGAGEGPSGEWVVRAIPISVHGAQEVPIDV